MKDIETFNGTKNWERIAAGLKGGPFNKTPAIPVRTIVNGWPSETLEKLGMQTPRQPDIIDGWNMRRYK